MRVLMVVAIVRRVRSEVAARRSRKRSSWSLRRTQRKLVIGGSVTDNESGRRARLQLIGLVYVCRQIQLHIHIHAIVSRHTHSREQRATRSVAPTRVIRCMFSLRRRARALAILLCVAQAAKHATQQRLHGSAWAIGSIHRQGAREPSPPCVAPRPCCPLGSHRPVLSAQGPTARCGVSQMEPQCSRARSSAALRVGSHRSSPKWSLLLSAAGRALRCAS